MKVRLLSLPMIVLVSVGTATAQDDAVKQELAGMAGGWQFVRGEDNGNPASEYIVRHLRCVIKGDQLTFQGIDPLTDRAGKLTMKLDPSTTPRCIDLKVDAGSMKGEVLEGIYEWKGDELKLCLYFGKRKRPLRFEAKTGSDCVLFVLKRESP